LSVLWAFFIETHFVDGCEEKDFSFAAIVDEDSGDVPSVDVDGDDHSVGMGKRG
jgi:hypothetical protein